MEVKREKFSIRKLSKGVASVAIASFMVADLVNVGAKTEDLRVEYDIFSSPIMDSEQFPDKKRLQKQVVWADFSQATGLETLPSGKKALKVGTVLEMHPSPGLVVRAEVTDLHPFSASDTYKKHIDEDENATEAEKNTYDANRKNSGHLVIRPQSEKYSNLARSGFNIPGEVTLETDENGDNVGAVFKISGTYHGNPIQPSMIITDGEEQTDNSREWTGFVTNGTPWELVANVGMEGAPCPKLMPPSNYDSDYFNINGVKVGKYYVDKNSLGDKINDKTIPHAGLGTQFFGGYSNMISKKYATPMAMTHNVSQLEVYVASRGKQSSMFGFVVMDYGDSADTFHQAYHLMKPMDGELPQPFLGKETADMDLGMPGPDWYRDDIYGADEGVVQLMNDAAALDLDGKTHHYTTHISSKHTYELPLLVNTAGNKVAYVRGWVDFNDDGEFTKEEQSNLLTVSNEDSNQQQILTFTNIPQTINPEVDELGMRVRIALNPHNIDHPTGYAFSGEVEDFTIHVVHPPRGAKKATQGFQGINQTISFTANNGFNAYGKHDDDYMGKNKNKMNIDEEHPVKIVLPNGKLSNTYNEEGIGKYEVSADGTITFTPDKKWDGKTKAKGVVLRAEDTNGRNSGWTADTEQNGLVNVNDGEEVGYLINGKKTMDAVYVPKVIAVKPIGIPKDTFDIQGKKQIAKIEFIKGNELIPMNDEVPAQLKDADGNLVDSITIEDEGTYTVAKDGTVTFTPKKDFVGKATGVTVVREDTNGTKAEAKYTPTVNVVKPIGENEVTTGPQGQQQIAKVDFTEGNPEVLMDNEVPAKLKDGEGNLVDSITVPNVGKYEVSKDGTVTFTPDKTYVTDPKHPAVPVTVVRVDKNGTKAEGSYTPIVEAVIPTAVDATSQNEQGQPQTGKPVFIPGNTAVPIDTTKPTKLKDAEGNLVDSITVPNVGKYEVSKEGTVTFTPDKTYVTDPEHPAVPVTVVRVDKNGTEVTATYTPTVTAVIPTGTPKETTDIQGKEQTGKPVFVAGSTNIPMNDEVPAQLKDEEGNLVDTITIKTEGTYTVAKDGTVTFTPKKDFVGKATGVIVVREDTNGTKAEAIYTPTVIAVQPIAVEKETIGKKGQKQTGAPTFISGNKEVPMNNEVPAKLKDKDDNLVDSITIEDEGTYTVATDGTVTFTPNKDFVGTGTGVTVVREDINGTKAEAKYIPFVYDDTCPVIEAPQTKYIDETGQEIFGPLDGNQPSKNIPGYKFVNTTTDGEGNIIHHYEKDDEPIPTPMPKVETKFVDESGKEIITAQAGNQAKENIPGYKFVNTTIDGEGNIIHHYEKVDEPTPTPTPEVETRFVDENGEEITTTQAGNQAKENIPGYKFINTTIDGEGNIIHHYEKDDEPTPTPMPKVETKFVDESGKEIITAQAGNQAKENIPGYKFINTTIDGEGNIIHHYEKDDEPTPTPTPEVETRFVDENGEEIATEQLGEQPSMNIPGYLITDKKVDANGNITYIYKKANKLPTTGVKSISTLFNLGGLFTLAGIATVLKRKK